MKMFVVFLYFIRYVNFKIFNWEKERELYFNGLVSIIIV